MDLIASYGTRSQRIPAVPWCSYSTEHVCMHAFERVNTCATILGRMHAIDSVESPKGGISNCVGQTRYRARHISNFALPRSVLSVLTPVSKKNKHSRLYTLAPRSARRVSCCRQWRPRSIIHFGELPLDIASILRHESVADITGWEVRTHHRKIARVKLITATDFSLSPYSLRSLLCPCPI